VTVAGAPTIRTVTASKGKLTVAFTAPSSNGGSSITNYEYSTNNGTTWKAFSLADTSTPLVITKRSDTTGRLVNGTRYQVKIRAVNSAGSGAASAAKSGKPFTVAGAPKIRSVTASAGKLTVAFTAPSSNGGRKITNYEYSTNNGTTWKAFSPVDRSTPLVITKRSNSSASLVNGTTYQVKIRAVNSAGSGAASTAKSIKAS
jgi:predicted RNA-binding protein with TRAM domain